MTEAFASSVTVTVPILALAAGAASRGNVLLLRRVGEEVRGPSGLARVRPGQAPVRGAQYFRDVPAVWKAYVIERALAIASAIVWFVVFALLAITELLRLVWLGDEAGPGDPGLATFSVITIGLALAALIMAPTVYLFMPVLLPFDLMPHGLKKAVAPKLAGKEGHGFVKVLLTELEGALERAVEKAEEATETGPGSPGDGEPPSPA